MTSKILLNQLQKLQTAHFKIDDGECKDFSVPFKEVIFYKRNSPSSTVKISFADYFVHPFSGFDFHEKWNDGVAPPCNVLYGQIDKETKGMYHFVGNNEYCSVEWSGWVPKKSCEIEEVKI